ADNFKKWAQEAGVDPAKTEELLKTKKPSAKVDADIAVASKIGASGTPAFRINGVTLTGAQHYEKLMEIIDQQLAEAKKLVDSGTKPADVYTKLDAKNAKAAPAGKEKGGKDVADAAPDNTVWAVPVYADDPVKGGKDALVTIVEFSEFQCPFCKRVGPTIKQILETYGDDVRIV